MVGKGVKLKDIIFHIVHHRQYFSSFSSLINSLTILDQNLKICTVVYTCRFQWQNVQHHTCIKKFVSLFQFQYPQAIHYSREEFCVYGNK